MGSGHGAGASARTGSVLRAFSRGRPGRTGVLAALVFFVLSSLWAVSTPIGASPDEPAHYIKAASVVRGQLIGAPAERPQDRVVQVPASVASTGDVMCLAYDPSATADCLPAVGSSTTIVDSVTTAGLYNPVYYALVGWPSLFDLGKAGLVLMRLVSAAGCAVLFGITVTHLARLRSPTLPVLAAFTAVTPMTAFLAGSVNPNALEIVGVAAFTAALLDLGTRTYETTRSSWWTAASLVVSGALVVHARGLSPVWILAAAVVVAVAVGVSGALRRLARPPYLLAVGVVALSTAAAAVWTLRSGSLGAVGVYSGAGTSASQGFVRMLETSVDYWHQAVGNFGWLDTPAPSYVTFLYDALLGVLVVSVLLFVRRSRAVAGVWLALAVALLVPPLVQAASVTESGYIWQGRYTMPALVVLVLMAAWAGADRFETVRPREARRVTVFVVLAVSLAHFVCLATNLKRYASGLWTSWATMVLEPVWHPPLLGAPAWLSVLFLGSMAAGAATLLVLAGARREEAPAWRS